jgi:hypothetical protein
MAIKDGFRKGCLLKEFKTTLIALLPKSLGAFLLASCKISGLSVSLGYKLLSKILGTIGKPK